jgi:hypothetical protein
MWMIILLLWSMPLALGILMLVRVRDGVPAITEEERRLFLGDSEDMTLSLWVGLKVTVLAVLFFVVGVVEGLVLINLGFIWVVSVPLATGLAAILLLAQVVRSASSAMPHQNTARSRAIESRIARILSR